MAKHCPLKNGPALYLDCKECDERACESNENEVKPFMSNKRLAEDYLRTKLKGFEEYAYLGEKTEGNNRILSFGKTYEDKVYSAKVTIHASGGISCHMDIHKKGEQACQVTS